MITFVIIVTKGLADTCDLVHGRLKLKVELGPSQHSRICDTQYIASCSFYMCFLNSFFHTISWSTVLQKEVQPVSGAEGCRSKAVGETPFGLLVRHLHSSGLFIMFPPFLQHCRTITVKRWFFWRGLKLQNVWRESLWRWTQPGCHGWVSSPGSDGNTSLAGTFKSSIWQKFNFPSWELDPGEIFRTWGWGISRGWGRGCWWGCWQFFIIIIGVACLLVVIVYVLNSIYHDKCLNLWQQVWWAGVGWAELSLTHQLRCLRRPCSVPFVLSSVISIIFYLKCSCGPSPSPPTPSVPTPQLFPIEVKLLFFVGFFCVWDVFMGILDYVSSHFDRLIQELFMVQL